MRVQGLGFRVEGVGGTPAAVCILQLRGEELDHVERAVGVAARLLLQVGHRDFDLLQDSGFGF